MNAGGANDASDAGRGGARRWRRLVAPGLVLAGALVGLALREEGRGGGGGGGLAPGPGSAGARALVGGLAVGDAVAGFEVEGITGAPETGVHIHLRRREVRLVVSIVPRGQEPHLPPAQSGRHDLFFGYVRPEEAELTGDEVRAILEALTARVRASEGA